MSNDFWNDFVAYSRLHFEEGLIRAGFTATPVGWSGSIGHGQGVTRVVITLPSRFPFRHPSVVPEDGEDVAWSWHRERDGALCLVAEDDHDDLWWTDSAAFLKHISAWFEEADAGWPSDRPDLDLERYFEPSNDHRTYLYDEIEGFRNAFVRFKPAKNDTMIMVRGTRFPKAHKSHKDRYGYVVELADVATPPRSWDDLETRLPEELSIGRKIRDGSISIVMVTYHRGDSLGALALDVSVDVERSITARALTSASTSADTRNLRAGLLAPSLSDRKIAIVGLGAIGSFIADALVRSGLRNLTLIDPDRILPGNLVRHLVGPSCVGLTKVEAVRRYLVERNDDRNLAVDTVVQRVDNGADAYDLIDSHDLVINASADFSTTALLRVAAASQGQHVLSVALVDHGATFRIDVLPPLSDVEATPVLDTPSLQEDVAELFEPGCGSPISPAPPHAVMESASAAVRHAIGILSGRPLDDAGETRNVAPQGETHES